MFFLKPVSVPPISFLYSDFLPQPFRRSASFSPSMIKGFLLGPPDDRLGCCFFPGFFPFLTSLSGSFPCSVAVFFFFQVNGLAIFFLFFSGFPLFVQIDFFFFSSNPSLFVSPRCPSSLLEIPVPSTPSPRKKPVFSFNYPIQRFFSHRFCPVPDRPTFLSLVKERGRELLNRPPVTSVFFKESLFSFRKHSHSLIN